MLAKIKTNVRELASKIKTVLAVWYAMLESALTVRVRNAVAGTRAEAYVDSGVKIIIAVVIGALLLGLVYTLFNETIRTSITQKVNELFNYNGGVAGG